jgi:hypothetical protein
MSRRLVVVLAASAALIATPAFADPECFGDSCRLPEVVEPPVAAAPAPDPVASEESAAPQASAKPARAPVQPIAPSAANLPKLAPSSARPQLTAEPAARKFAPAAAPAPLDPPALRDEPVEIARAPVRARSYASADRDSSAGALAGIPLAAAPPAVGVPTVIYGGFGVRPVYLVAPSAKIIHIDRDDD